MRSTESLTSMSNESLFSADAVNITTSLKALAYIHDETLIVIPVPVVVDSEAIFESASALIKFQIFQRKPDNSLEQYLKENRTGARLIRRLLLTENDEDRAAYLCPHVIEPVTYLDLRKPLFRPVNATLKYSKKTEDSVYVSVILAFNSAIKTKMTVKTIEMTFSDSVSRKEGAFLDFGLIKIEPISVQVPEEIGPHSTFTSIFMAHLMPSSLKRFSTGGHKMHVDSLMETPESGEIKLHFESDVNLSELFLHHESRGLIVSLKYDEKSIHVMQPFDVEFVVKNGTSTNKDVSLKIPISTPSAPPTFLVNGTSPIFNNEQIVDVHYAAMEPQMTAFIPLCKEVHIGKLRPGDCISAFCPLLPISIGRHSVRSVVVTERIEGRTYELVKALDLIVLPRTE